jgi:hypothetical protein
MISLLYSSALGTGGQTATAKEGWTVKLANIALPSSDSFTHFSYQFTVRFMSVFIPYPLSLKHI